METKLFLENDFHKKKFIYCKVFSETKSSLICILQCDWSLPGTNLEGSGTNLTNLGLTLSYRKTKNLKIFKLSECCIDLRLTLRILPKVISPGLCVLPWKWCDSCFFFLFFLAPLILILFLAQDKVFLAHFAVSFSFPIDRPNQIRIPDLFAPHYRTFHYTCPNYITKSERTMCMDLAAVKKGCALNLNSFWGEAVSHFLDQNLLVWTLNFK